MFYIVLYAFLAGFFAALLTVFFQTLDEHTPTWTMQSSLLGANPGMGYRPLHPSPDQSVISYTATNTDSVAMWANATDAFLQRTLSLVVFLTRKFMTSLFSLVRWRSST